MILYFGILQEEADLGMYMKSEVGGVLTIFYGVVFYLILKGVYSACRNLISREIQQELKDI